MESLLKTSGGEDQERLVYILETGIKVCNQTQFFAWTQGPLQALLPHEILICGHSFGQGAELKLRYFTSTRYFTANHFSAACNPRHGLITEMVRHWHGRPQPMLIACDGGAHIQERHWPEVLHRLELRNMIAHGTLSTAGGIQGWFGFCRVPEISPQTAHLLDLLMPCISATYARMICQERREGVQAINVGRLLSQRELEVLKLVRDGHTNSEVAARLEISAMTAKNHLQNIRAKLKVHTRTQAVAEAIRLSLLTPDG